jgi:hypothetical protein
MIAIVCIGYLGLWFVDVVVWDWYEEEDRVGSGGRRVFVVESPS